MSWLAGLMGAVLAVMVLVHLARPRMERRRVSSRRFFRELPPISRSARRWRWNPPPMTLGFWLRVTVIGLLLAALLSLGIEWQGGAVRVSGLAVLLDTSASLSTRLPEGRSRFQQALQRLEDTLQQAQQASEASCFRLLAFDLEVREIASGSAPEVLAAARGLSARALGTDLDLVRQSTRRLLGGDGQVSPPARGRPQQPEAGAGRPSADASAACPVGAVVAISDRPAPEWASELSAWFDVGRPVDNAGFTSLSARRDPLTGRVDEVLVELRFWGTPPASARLRVQAPDGSVPYDQPLTWTRNRADIRFAPAAPGLHRLILTPADAYAYDNQAAADIPPPRLLRVDWRIQAPGVLQRLGWEAVTPSAEEPGARPGSGSGGRRPDLRVLPIEALDEEAGTGTRDQNSSADQRSQADASSEQEQDSSAIPILYIGPGYAPRRSSVPPAGNPPGSQISDFRESSRLLDGLNFDVAERMGIAPPPRPLPASFSPVLRGLNGTWMALRQDPPAVYIPGPPLGSEDDSGRFSTTVFFNAVRHLLGRRSLPPLHTLTSPADPVPEGSRLALHDEEGNTSFQPRSAGDVTDLSPTASRAATVPLWPVLLALTAALFLWEVLWRQAVSHSKA